MKKIIISFIFCFSVTVTFAQRETYDLATYTPPKGWVKEVKANSYTCYTMINKQKNDYCRIFVMASVASKGNINDDFNSEWQNLVVSQYSLTAGAQVSAPENKGGWIVKSGIAPFIFNNGQAAVMLYTISGFGKIVSIVSITNNKDYNPAISKFLASIQMKKTATVDLAKEQIVKPLTNGRFSFTTTNFDDGWVATEQADWVLVTKGTTRILIHYPNKKADAYNSVVMDGLKNAWNILVASRYSSAGNFEFKPITGWQTIEFAEADMVEKGTGRSVHVVLFKMNYSNGSGRYMEFITPDKRAFEQEFGPYHQTTSGWEKMEKMVSYNKFAVAASDLQGKWTSDFSGAIQYVNASTGLDAGMDTHASIENFNIGPGNTYNWDIGVASGQVGNIKFQTKRSGGRLTMTGNWKVNFSDIEGRSRSYDIYFSCIKNLRILWLDNKPYAKIN